MSITFTTLYLVDGNTPTAAPLRYATYATFVLGEPAQLMILLTCFLPDIAILVDGERAGLEGTGRFKV